MNNSFEARQKLEHYMKPVNVYSNLIKAGVPEAEAMETAREYEKNMTQSKLFKLLFNP